MPPLDEYDLLLDSVLPKPSALGATVSHLDELTEFAREHGLMIGSTTGGTHNVGSRHYSGNAIDIKGSGGFSNEQVAALKQAASARGLLVRDERSRPAGQKVWGGPHVHIEKPKQDAYDDLLDEVIPRKADAYDALLKEVAPSAAPSRGDYMARQIQAMKSPDTGMRTVPQEPGVAPQGQPPITKALDRLSRFINRQTAYAGISHNDVAHHFGITDEEWARMKPKQQMLVARLSAEAAASDMGKRQKGQTEFPVSLTYQNENRAKVGLAKLEPQPEPEAKSSVPDINQIFTEARSGHPQSFSEDRAMRERLLNARKRQRQLLVDVETKKRESELNSGVINPDLPHGYFSKESVARDVDAQLAEAAQMETRRPEIDKIKSKLAEFGQGKTAEQVVRLLSAANPLVGEALAPHAAQIIESVQGQTATSGVQLGNLIHIATGGRYGGDLTDKMRLTQHALAEIDQEDPDKGWMALAARTLPAAGLEAAKMMTLSAIPGVGRLTLPGLGALSESDKGFGPAASGAFQGELFHRGFGLTAAMSPVGKFLTWTSIPAAIAIAQGEEPYRAILSNTAFGAMALVHPRVQVAENGKLRDATIEDVDGIQSGKLKVATPGTSSGVPAEADVELRQQFQRAAEEFRTHVERSKIKQEFDQIKAQGGGQTNAIETGQVTENDLSQRVGTSPREDLRAYSGEVRQQEGQRSGSGDRLGQSGQIEQEGLIAPQVGEPLSHRNPVIAGKPIVATTEAGKAIVANPENKGGISVVKHQPEVPTVESRASELTPRTETAIPPAGQPPLAEVALNAASPSERSVAILEAKLNDMLSGEFPTDDPSARAAPISDVRKALEVARQQAAETPVEPLVAEQKQNLGEDAQTSQLPVQGSERQNVEPSPTQKPVPADREGFVVTRPINGYTDAQTHDYYAAEQQNQNRAVFVEQSEGLGTGGKGGSTFRPFADLQIKKINPDGSAMIGNPSMPEGVRVAKGKWKFTEPRFRVSSNTVTDLQTRAYREFDTPQEAQAEAQKLNANPPTDTSFAKVVDYEDLDRIKHPHMYRANGERISLRDKGGAEEIAQRREELKSQPSPQVEPAVAKQTPREVVEAAGLTYLGEQQMLGGKPPGHMFNVGDATLMITGEVTPETIAQKVKTYFEKKAGLPVVPEPLDSVAQQAENVARETSTEPAGAEPIREARIPARPVAEGAETEVSVPDSDRTYRARYVVRELEDVVPSHNSQNFRPRPDYYHVNDRQYQNEPQYQVQVIDRSRPEKFNPRAVLNNSPTVEVGPSVTDSNGNVLGGNSRQMIIERVYAATDPRARDAYRKALTDQASVYGLDAKQIENMKQPVLVRELSDTELSKPEIQRAITELNRTSTTPLTSVEQASAAAGNVSEDAARFITQMIERGGDDATIRTVMDSDGPAIINRLIEDGVIQPGERNTLMKDGNVTLAAKDRIEKMLVSNVYRDMKQMEDTPDGVKRNIERIVAPLRRIAGTEWDLADQVRTAIDVINEAKGTTKGNLDMLAGQTSLNHPPFTADEIALAKALRLGPRRTAEKFRGYANDYADARSGGGLFGAPTRAESLMVHFGLDQIMKAHLDPVVDEAAKRIIAATENGNLANMSASVESAPSEARMQIHGLTAEIAKEKASGQETAPIERPVGSGSETGSKVSEADQGTSRVPELSGAAGAEELALQEQLRQARAKFRASRGESSVPQEPTENLGPGAASAKELFPEVKERQFGVNLMADEQIAQDIKDSLGTSRYYEPIPNNVTAKDAQRLVDERGIPQSMHAIMDENNNIPFHVRSAMGQIVIKRLNQVYKGLKTSSPSDAEIVLDQATNMSEWQMDYGTRLGQGVQSFAMWARLSPEGKLLTFKRAVNKARQRHLALKGGEVQQILKGMEDARVVEVKPEDTTPIVPAIRKALAKRAVRAKKAAESGQEDVSIWQEYKDSIAKQLFNIASPGKTAQSPPLQEFSERLLANVEPLIRKPETIRAKPDLYGNLREVVENFDKYREAWNEAVSYIRGKYDQKSVADLNNIERRITDLNSAFQTKAFDRVFESAVRQAEINFQEVAKAHYLDRQGTRDSLIVDIQKRIGIELSPEDAADLASKIEQRMEAKIIIARQRILKGMESTNKTAKKVSSLTDKIIEAARVGVLNEQKFYDIASEKLGLPKYDPQVAAKILDLAGHVEDAPDGIPKDRAILDLNRYIASQKGFGAEDLPIGIYYGNILSGYNTHIVNAVDTALNVLSEVNGLALTNPRAAARVYAGALRGLTEGRFDALMALTEGRMKTEGKWIEAPQLMEVARFGEKGGVPVDTSSRIGRTAKAIAESKIAIPLNAYKYVTRLLAASDTVFAQSAKEARAALLADRMARAEGATGDELSGRVKEILALDRDADFRAQAVREGFTGSEITVRANELRDLIRDASLESDAADFAGEATYNHDPHGLLGILAQQTSKLSQTIPPLKLFVPFTRIVANVTNRGLNYTPYGYKRAFGYGKVAEGRYRLMGEPLSLEAQRLMLTRATLGTAGLVLLGSLQAAGVLTIHGAGPSDIERRRQLQQAGWRPYSIQIGDHFISYTPAPIGLGLSIIGNMSDAERYHELEQKDIATRGAYAVARVGSTVFSQSFLSGLSRMFNALSENPNESVTAVKQTLSGTASSLTIPALGKDVYKLFDNKAYQSNTLMQDLIRNTPFAALALKPQLNAFGEPVRVQRQRFLDVMTDDPEWRFVIEKGLRVPVPSKTSEIDEYKADGTQAKRRIQPDEYYELLSKTGPRVKLWIGVNRDLLATMSEQDAQELLSKEAGKITADEMTKIRSTARVTDAQQQTAVPSVPAEPTVSP